MVTRGQTSNKAQYFAKYAKKQQNLLHQLKEKHTVEYNQAMKVHEEKMSSPKVNKLLKQALLDYSLVALHMTVRVNGGWKLLKQLHIVCPRI